MKTVINVNDFTNKDNRAIFYTHGVELGKKLEEHLSKKEQVILSFKDVVAFNLPFINGVLGTACCIYSKKELDQLLCVSGLNNEMQFHFERCAEHVRWSADNTELHQTLLQNAINNC